MIVDILCFIVRIWLFIYDFFTFPLYYIYQQPFRKLAKVKENSLFTLNQTDDFISISKKVKQEKDQHKELIKDKNVDTVYKLWQNSVNNFKGKNCLGTRQVLGEEDEKQSSGKIFKKLSLGEYKWISYQQADKIVSAFGSGLVKLGMEPKQTISIYAETRKEWLLSAIGAFSQNMIVSTLYTNLGDEAVTHGINETEATMVVTSHSLLPKLKKILLSGQCPKVKQVIYMEDELFKSNTDGFPEHVQISSFQAVVRMGEESPSAKCPPEADDTAIIMYTSGSTGVPKGVLLSHFNMVTTCTAIMYLGTFSPKDTFLAYLPLAHVLELLSELTMLLVGVQVGYSTPNTMTDASSAIKKGQKGDVTLLQPTLIASVPLILVRIQKNIQEAVRKQGPAFQKIFKMCYDYKLSWNKSGFTTPILSATIFKKIRNVLGGKLTFMLSGSAPLSAETQEYLRTCLDISLVQGYSLTEASSCGTVQAENTTSVGDVGGPMFGMKIRLVNWDEGGYKITDKPNPRGELMMGGPSISKGYFKNDQKTEEEFFNDDGVRYFKTGDIVEFLPNGYFKIIDRKKDLVKLQAGEYVSLGKVESQLKTHQLVDNICVYADSQKTHTVALLVPIRDQLEKFAAKEINSDFQSMSFEQLCEDDNLEKAIVKTLFDHGRKHGLEKFEIPTKIKLVSNPWMPESGLVTAALKLKRKEIQKYYQNDIDKMYKS